MANITDLYASKYLKADDIEDSATFKIKEVEVEEQEFDGKLERFAQLTLSGTRKKLRLNKTNGRILIQKFGPDTDDWEGKRITVRSVNGRKPDGTPCLTLSISLKPSKETEDLTDLEVETAGDKPF